MAGDTGKSNFLTAGHKPHGSSNEDLSEYTDADESVSAPTEFLSEVFIRFNFSFHKKMIIYLFYFYIYSFYPH